MLLPAALLMLSTSVPALVPRAGEAADAAAPRTLSVVDGRLRLEPETPAAPRSGARLGLVDGQLVLLEVPADADTAAAEEDGTLPARTTLTTPAERALDLVRVAVERGAPLFNAGQPEACEAIYDVAIRGLLNLDVSLVDAELRAGLDGALAEAARVRDAADSAWILRAGLDQAVIAFSRDAPTPRPRLEQRELFDLGSGSDWPAVNDNVMGGVSRGALNVTDRGTAVFSGRLSLENNGGFSTVRSAARDLDLAGWDGLWIRVRGDGRSYQLSAMKDASRRNVHIWQAPFETEPDTWLELRIPFADLEHRVMGWKLPDAIDPASIRALAFGISDKDTRPFALEIDWIRAYRAP